MGIMNALPVISSRLLFFLSIDFIHNNNLAEILADSNSKSIIRTVHSAKGSTSLFQSIDSNSFVY